MFTASLKAAEGPETHWILIVLNDDYLYLGLILLVSLVDHVDKRIVAGLAIGDVGLSEKSRRVIRAVWPGVVFLKSDSRVYGGKAQHDQTWIFAVSQKTLLVRQALSEGLCPLVMMDADQFVCADFLKGLPRHPLLCIAQRQHPYHRPDGQVLRYIASFARFRNAEAIEFLDEWIRAMALRVGAGCLPPYETPAMCDVLQKPEGEIWQVHGLPDSVYSSPKRFLPNHTMVLHLKGYQKRNQSIFRDWVRSMQGITPELMREFDANLERVQFLVCAS